MRGGTAEIERGKTQTDRDKEKEKTERKERQRGREGQRESEKERERQRETCSPGNIHYNQYISNNVDLRSHTVQYMC